MGLNIQKGNMYEFITHTWNTVKGHCPHGCVYCYMRRFGTLKAPRLDESEFKSDLGKNNFIFVGSSNDLFCNEHPAEWTIKTLDYCSKFDNKYLFQSKNPRRMLYYEDRMPEKSVVCTTLETNRFYEHIMSDSPKPIFRARFFKEFSRLKYITVEPVMDFDLLEFLQMIVMCNPMQVNIGANTGSIQIPEPSKDKVIALKNHLGNAGIKVVLKSNLKRIIQ